MEFAEIMTHVDHTLLARDTTRPQIEQLVDEAIEYNAASVCVPPCWVRAAAECIIKKGAKTAVCTVIGFPNGYNTTASKVFEAQQALADGADELDMVINVGEVKAGDYDAVAREIVAMRTVCRGKILKVIIETCLLTEEEKIRLCHVVADSGADFIKTSTGFSTGGATREDIALMAREIGGRIGIKAAGGIKSIADAEDFLRLGATRLGTSSLVRIAKQQAPASY